ncbi:MAG: response regulator [Proteobacteria bacterium]|nr:response regulator [Pseudomonadota bacterium]
MIEFQNIPLFDHDIEGVEIEVVKTKPQWKILVADDEEAVHQLMRIVLRDFSFEGLSVQIFDAYSGEEAKQFLKNNPDVAVVFLDIVMETSHTGLDIIHFIRKEQKNSIVQIVLQTGQTGIPPEFELITQYSVNEFLSKVELSSRKLFTTVTTLLRSYSLSFSVNQLNKKLEKELNERKLFEQALKNAQNELEKRVNERTKELILANYKMAMEIEERNRAEKALRESEERHRALFDNNPVPTIIVDKNARVVRYNLAKGKSGNRSPAIGDLMYRDYAGNHDIDMYSELMDCIKSGVVKEFPARRYDDSFLHIRISPFFEGAIITAIDITDSKRAEEQIHTLTQELIKAQESERQRIARDLHDKVAQDLASLTISCKTIFDHETDVSDELRKKVERFSTTLKNSISAVRELSYNLRPPNLDQLGLVQTIYRFCEDFSESNRIKVKFHSAGVNDLELDFDTEINLYRIVQEGLNNVRKHAKAENATIRFTAAYPNIILRIEDDGAGFDVKRRLGEALSEKRMGIRNMRERVYLLKGKFRIHSHESEGTKVIVEIPYMENKIKKKIKLSWN